VQAVGGRWLVGLLAALQVAMIVRSYTTSFAPPHLTYRQFFARELWTDVAAALPAQKSGYRVASLGLFPSIPLLHGFRCADGYIQNYPLAYKRRFREAIAPELELDDELRRYFDRWGSRCYLFSRELGKQFQVLKGSSPHSINDWRIDAPRLCAIGVDYVFSAVEIRDAGRLDLHHVGTFEREGVPWQIYVYATRGPLADGSANHLPHGPQGAGRR
jgi:hypothetical protein